MGDVSWQSLFIKPSPVLSKSGKALTPRAQRFDVRSALDLSGHIGDRDGLRDFLCAHCALCVRAFGSLSEQAHIVPDKSAGLKPGATKQERQA